MRRLAVIVLVALALFVAAILLFDRGTSPLLDHAATGALRGPGAEPAPSFGSALPSTVDADLLPRALAPTVEPARRASNDAPAGLQLVVHVMHPDEAPAGGASLALARGDLVLDRGVTETDGRACLAGGSGAADLWIGGATACPVRVPLAAAAGECDVRLPDGASIQGVVHVAGASPGERVALRLEGCEDDPPCDDPPDTIADALVIALPAVGQTALSRGVQTALDGSFRISGLPENWCAEVEVPNAWRLIGNANPDPDDDSDIVRVTTPAMDVVIELERVPRLRLRVLDVDGKTPVPGANVNLSFSAVDGGVGDDGACDGDGRFSYPMFQGFLRELRLDVSRADGSALRHVEWRAIDARTDVDLGDIVLRDSADVRLLVVGPDGRPIVGAIAVPASGPTDGIEPAGVDGMIVLRAVSADVQRVVVLALGWQAVDLALPEVRPSEPLRVVLHACSRLDVFMRGLGEAPTEVPWLVVEASTDIAGESGELRDLRARSVFGCSKRQYVQVLVDPQEPHRVVRTAWYFIDAGSPVGLGCVEASLPLRLHVIDATGAVLATRNVLAPGAGEWREEELVVTNPAWDLPVLVTDPDGRPLRARVTVTSVRDASHDLAAALGESAGSVSTMTDGNGLVVVRGLHAALVDVEAVKQGSVPAVLRGVLPGERPHLVLDRGRQVRVRATAPDGRDAPMRFVYVATLEGARLDVMVSPAPEAQRLRGGLATAKIVSGLPPERLLFEINVGMRHFSIEHDAREPELVVSVPAFGGLELRFREALDQRFDHSVRMAGAGLGAGIAYMQLPTSTLRGEREACSVPAIFEGDYELAHMRRLARSDEDEEQVGESLLVSVSAGEVVEVELP